MRLIESLFGYDYFISYSRQDGGAYAHALARLLDEANLRCFLDAHELPSGQSLGASLEFALKRSSALIVVVTPGARESPYVALEVGLFAKTKRRIVPLLLDAERSLPWASVGGRDLVWLDDSPAASAEGIPSVAVVRSLDAGLRIVRKRTKALRIMLLVGAALVGLSVWAAIQTKGALDEQARAKEATLVADRAETRARAQADVARRAEQAAEQRREQARVEALARLAGAGTLPNETAVRIGIEAVRRANAAKLPLLPIAEHALLQAVAKAEGMPLVPQRNGVEAKVDGFALSRDHRWLLLSIEGAQAVQYDTTRLESGPVWRDRSGHISGNTLFVGDDGNLLVATSRGGNSATALGRASGFSDSLESDGYHLSGSKDTTWLTTGKSLVHWGSPNRRVVYQVGERELDRLDEISPNGKWVVSTWQDMRLRRTSAMASGDRRPDLLVRQREFPLPTNQDPQPGATSGEGGPESQEQSRNVQFTSWSIQSTHFSPDSRWLAAYSGSTVMLWDLSTDDFRRMEIEVGHHLVSTNVEVAARMTPWAFSRSGRYFATATEEDGLVLVDLQARRQLRSRSIESDRTGESFQSAFRAVALSDDGRWLAAAGVNTVVWDLGAPKPLARPRHVLRGSRLGAGTDGSLRFSPDGRWLVAGADGGKLWDLSHPEPSIYPILLLTDESVANAFVFSPDSRHLMALGNSGLTSDPRMYRWWPLEPELLLRIARKLSGRDLSREEWQTVLPGEPFQVAR